MGEHRPCVPDTAPSIAYSASPGAQFRITARWASLVTWFMYRITSNSFSDLMTRLSCSATNKVVSVAGASKLQPTAVAQ